MENIKKSLIENGYEIFESNEDYKIEGNNDILNILIMKKDENKYLVRNAILCYFDRWANSGTEFYANSENEVIKYFSDKDKCVVDAVSELVSTIVELSEWYDDDKYIKNMIGSLYSFVIRLERELEDKI